jgi:cytochrome c553
MRSWILSSSSLFPTHRFHIVADLWVTGLVLLACPAAASGAFVQGSPTAAQRTVWDGVYTEAQAERGRAAYTAECSGCHAPDLRGDNTSPSLVGMSFAFLWGGATLGALFERIREVMPPERPGTLPNQTYQDVLAYMLKANSYPGGQRELESDDLGHILISDKPDAEP